MNRNPRKRFVTLMAAAAGVTAGLGSMATSAEAQSRTPASAAVAADTLKAKPAAAPANNGAAAPAKAAPAKTAAEKAAAEKAAAEKANKAPAAAAKKPAAKKPVVSTANPAPSVNDVCADDPDCRNVNGGGY